MAIDNTIIILGGAKTGFNLYQYVKKLGFESDLYFFAGEYSEKRNIGKSFKECWDSTSTLNHSNIFVASETAFNALHAKDRTVFANHYYLRDKENMAEISSFLHTSFIREVDLSHISFPIAIKPKESSSNKVPFKIKKVNGLTEFNKFRYLSEDCIIQPYLSEEDHIQVAVAGYFDGYPSSLIAVQQKNQYPKGISAYVLNQTVENLTLIKHISKYLNELGYRGFIEFEFKKNKRSGEIFLMDINPRPWGWFHFYLDGIRNFREVILYDKPVELEMKKAWINLPRLAMANVHGKFINPSFKMMFTNDICYEPMF